MTSTHRLTDCLVGVVTAAPAADEAPAEEEEADAEAEADAGLVKALAGDGDPVVAGETPVALGGDPVVLGEDPVVLGEESVAVGEEESVVPGDECVALGEGDGDEEAGVALGAAAGGVLADAVGAGQDELAGGDGLADAVAALSGSHDRAAAGLARTAAAALPAVLARKPVEATPSRALPAVAAATPRRVSARRMPGPRRADRYRTRNDPPGGEPQRWRRPGCQDSAAIAAPNAHI